MTGLAISSHRCSFNLHENFSARNRFIWDTYTLGFYRFAIHIFTFLMTRSISNKNCYLISCFQILCQDSSLQNHRLLCLTGGNLVMLTCRMLGTLGVHLLNFLFATGGNYRHCTGPCVSSIARTNRTRL